MVEQARYTGPQSHILLNSSILGGACLDLTRRFPNLHFVVEDRAAIIEKVQEFWKITYPEALQTGRVQLVPHNFFEEQPIKGADVYFMRFILSVLFALLTSTLLFTSFFVKIGMIGQMMNAL